LEDLSLNGRIILKLTLHTQDVKMRTGFISCLGYGLMVGSFEDDDVLSGFTNSKEFLD
jgi:hypothetical protein